MTIINEFHDIRIFVDDYEKILMIVIEFDIVAQLQYLKQLAQSLNNYEVQTREIRLIKQLRNFDKTINFYR